MKILQMIIIISICNMAVSSSFLSGFFACFSEKKKDKKNKIIQEPEAKLTKYHEALANKYKIDTLLQCKPTSNFTTEIQKKGKKVGEGGQGAVYGSGETAYKIMEEKNDRTFERGYEEYKVLKMFEDYDKTNNTSLFQKNIQCKLDWNQKKGYLIIQQQLLGQNLEFDKDEQGGKDFKDVPQIRQSMDFRYELYTNLFHQLSVYKQKNLVHRDIKPLNITSNKNFLDLQSELSKAKTQQEETEILQQLKLMIIDYGIMTKEGDTVSAGTAFYLHPLQLLYPDSEGKASHIFDIYQLVVSLAQIELYFFANNSEYLFSKYNGNAIENHVNQLLGKYSDMDQFQLELVKYIKNYMRDYQERIVRKSCSATQVEVILENLKVFNKYSKKTKSFYDKTCGDCYACVLASAFQSKTEHIPSVQDMLEGFLIVAQKRAHLKRIIQLLLQIVYLVFIVKFFFK